jgi:hypothetical protein
LGFIIIISGGVSRQAAAASGARAAVDRVDRRRAVAIDETARREIE